MFKSFVAITLVLTAASLVQAQELGWQKVVAPDSSFSFEMPGEVALDSAVSVAGSEPVTTYFYVSALPVGSFVVSYTDLNYIKGMKIPESQLRTILEGGLPNAMATLDDVEVIYNERTMLDSNQGRKIQVTGTNAGTPLVYTSRSYLVGLRVYEIMTQSIIGAIPGEYFKRFFESFTLLKTN